MTEEPRSAPRRSLLNPLLGAAGVVVTGGAVVALLSPVFRQANCYPSNVGAAESATTGFVMALVASVLLFWFGRRGSIVWPAVAVLATAALFLLGGILLFGPLSLSSAWGGGCGLEAIEIYARLLWLQLPIALAAVGLVLGRLSHKRVVVVMFAIVVVLAVVAFCVYRVWFWPTMAGPAYSG